MYLFVICQHTCAMVHMCVSKDSFQKLVLFFYHLGSSVGNLGDKCHNAITCQVISHAQ